MKKSAATVLWVIVLLAEYGIASHIVDTLALTWWLPEILIFLVVFLAGDLLVTFVLSKLLKVEFNAAWDMWMGAFKRE